MTANSSKWPCPRCTYLNWPRSRVCSLCLSENPNPINEIADPIDVSGPASDQWTCPECTFYNSVATATCSVCNANKSLANPCPLKATEETSASDLLETSGKPLR